MQRRRIPDNNPVSGSFRDPSGWVFKKNGSFYRNINFSYKANYDFLINSGLYQSLVNDKLLIAHKEIPSNIREDKTVFKVIKPEIIPFISYPYEWSFSQLKNAALATIQIQKRALEFGMSLKDASAYNIQFLKGQAILIDTLSFEGYQEGRPWVGYRQFCQHFLAPLALMCYKDLRMNRLSQIFIDGIPLDLASILLPLSTYLKFQLLTHIHLHTKSKKYLKKNTGKLINTNLSKSSLFGLIDNLESAVLNLKYKFKGSDWGGYYSDTNYLKEGFEQKKQVIKKFLKIVNPKMVWDLGANTGLFSRIAAKLKILTISIDSDPEAVETNYLCSVKEKEENILPLLVDLVNPSPGIGWKNSERMSLEERGPADMVIALALIHHLAISNNLQFSEIADFLKNICRFLVIEFVPKNDSNAKTLFAFREDIFPNYTLENFIAEFGKHFTIKDSIKIKHSQRMLFLMERKGKFN